MSIAQKRATLTGEWDLGAWVATLGLGFHVPMRLAIGSRNQVEPDGDLWMSVLEATGQPRRFG